MAGSFVYRGNNWSRTALHKPEWVFFLISTGMFDSPDVIPDVGATVSGVLPFGLGVTSCGEPRTQHPK